MKLLSNAARHQEDIAKDFAKIVEEGRALLGEMAEKPAKTTRDTIDQVGEKVSDLQEYALGAVRHGAARGAKYGRQADRYLRENPWPTLGGGIALGVLAALWWGRYRR